MKREKEEEKIDFLENHKEVISTKGEFWTERNLHSIKRAIESDYKPNVVRHYSIVDIIINGKDVLVKWEKRIVPLSDEELKEKYKQ